MPPRRPRPPAEKYHDRVAGLYDGIYAGSPYWRLVHALAWRHMRRWLPAGPARRCLDVGCGTGLWGLRLIKAGFDADFLDLSRKMLDQAALKLARLGRPLEARGAMASGEGEAAPGAAADAADSGAAGLREGTSVLWHASVDDLRGLPAGAYGLAVGQGDPLGCASRPGQALRGLARLLAPGGVAILSVDNRWQGMRPFLEAGDVDGLRAFVADGKTRWVTDNPEERYPVATFTPDGLRALCRGAGLEPASLIGKTVLPLRRFKGLLDDPRHLAELACLEEKLHGEESLLANAAHLQIVARKPG